MKVNERIEALANALNREPEWVVDRIVTSYFAKHEADGMYGLVTHSLVEFATHSDASGEAGNEEAYTFLLDYYAIKNRQALRENIRLRAIAGQPLTPEEVEFATPKTVPAEFMAEFEELNK